MKKQKCDNMFSISPIKANIATKSLSMQIAYFCPSASMAESGSSLLLVSGSRKQRAPLISVRLLKTMMGMDQWYMANMLSSGDNNPATLKAMEPIPTAVCLEEWRVHFQTYTAYIKYHSKVWIHLLIQGFFLIFRTILRTSKL